MKIESAYHFLILTFSNPPETKLLKTVSLLLDLVQVKEVLQFSPLSLNAVGLIPNSFLNIRLKYRGSLNPVS